MKIKVILTGATGMVGEGVLHECLLHENVEEILVLGRKASGITHPKLKEIVHSNLYDLSTIKNQLVGYNACFYCLGTTSVGKKEQEYYKITYELTMYIATALSKENTDMIFCYISGAGTDNTEKGRIMWARVKGKTENALATLPFRQVYNFRPGIIQPTRGLKNTLSFYKYLGWLIPIIRLAAPNAVSGLKEVGLAMIHAAETGYEKQILEVSDIKTLAKR